MRPKRIIVTATDHFRLRQVLNGSYAQAADPQTRRDLDTELQRAEIVDSLSVPPDVVTMNSVVELRDLEDDSLDVYTLVYPSRADIAEGRLSILSPIGTAILGYRAGDVIEWRVPAGLRRLRIETVELQPEREGQYQL
ncbi:nucleoside diphosphate kinase regulator [Rubinisphaera margarita]|uniref:nucleoside diphosphate kinase regulator n=1 Tax=Rubinisphaera margarita TaxID=2909586 RepID=UPI001EE81EE5|nr:nucleoside diphosphate kinase regulator [Rubinisphaera margarita]MCG6158147.1 nucleoside diphosphate kinase regulator [Rubinisphaera margarita]